MACSLLRVKEMVVICSLCQREGKTEAREESPSAEDVTYQVCDRHTEAIYFSIRETIARSESEAKARRDSP